MKNYLKIFIIILLISFSFINCSIDNSNTYYPPVSGVYWQPYQMNANGQYPMGGPVNTYSAGTRAYSIQTDDIINNYSDFSLFSWTTDSVVMNNYNGVINNQTYTWGYTENQKYFDNNVSKYNFIGIIPFNNSLTLKNDNTIDVNLVDFKTENVNPNDEKYNKEFIVAQTDVESSNYAQGATLNFYHQNSIVRIKFETDNTNNLEILDFTPYTPEVPYQPAVPGTETYTSKSTKFIDELVAGNEVQVPIGFVGSSSPKLTATNPTSLYIGTNNPTYNYYAKDWLLSIKDAVNAQFEYYRLDAVASSTSKVQVNDEDWESKSSNKKLYMMKLADGVNATDFAAGNDAFWTALCAHETDWVGGSPAASFKSMFQKAYDEGWRVIRINTNVAYKTFPSDMTVESTNNNEVYVFLANNSTVTTQVCETTGGTPEIPYQPATGKNGIVVLPATSTLQTGKDAILSTFPETVTANVGLNSVSYTVDTEENEIVFTKPGVVAYSVYSPTNWYTFPVVHTNDFGFTIKFSYTLNGVTRYDARVFVPAIKCNWQPGKWYDYVITVNSTKHGKVDPSQADPTDPKIEEEFPIIVNTTPLNIDTYIEGEVWTFGL